jgi:hypothetical protein
MCSGMAPVDFRSPQHCGRTGPSEHDNFADIQCCNLAIAFRFAQPVAVAFLHKRPEVISFRGDGRDCADHPALAD